MKKAPKTILVCCIRVIGDVILTTPLIEVLKRAYPDASIDMMVAAGTGAFLKRDPRIRNVIEAPSKEMGNHRSIWNDISVLRSIFKKYDMAINMNSADRGTLATICAGRELRVGFSEGDGFVWKKFLLTDPIPYDVSGHTAHLCKLVADALGISVSQIEVKVCWNDDDSELVRQRLDTVTEGSGYFVVHPFARWDYKYWSMESFVAVTDKIALEYGLTPIWTSSPDVKELALLDQFAPQCLSRPLIIRGEFSLNQMACLISRARLYLGLDTAVSHIAASTGVPMIALYGPTAMSRWFPWNNQGAADQYYGCQRGSFRNGNIVSIQKSCEHPSWCNRKNCINQCMSRISVEEVFVEAADLLHDEGRQMVAKQDNVGFVNG